MSVQKIHYQRILWQDYLYLKRYIYNSRAFVLPSGFVSVGFVMGRRVKIPEELSDQNVLVRPTGGGLVIHGCDVCFGFSVPGVVHNKLDRREVYKTIAEVISKFLELEFAISAEMTTEVRQEGLFCQDMHSYGELMVKGRKICGMALRIWRKGFVLQGTLNVLPWTSHPLSDRTALQNVFIKSISISEICMNNTSVLQVSRMLEQYLNTKKFSFLKYT